jgi:flagellin-like hook-associated protein FlgL
VKDALGEIDAVLHKMRALSVQAAGEKTSPFERVLAQKNIEGYIADIDRIAEETEAKAAQLFSGFPPDPNKPLH